ncbi:MAG TPA: GNAT family N-acetyltransferase [Candidatus Saccharimonadales bacterium]|nr:GNAT family N-acetyltransferase [Candidatus Saccharimonadales bacterium]
MGRFSRFEFTPESPDGRQAAKLFYTELYEGRDPHVSSPGDLFGDQELRPHSTFEYYGLYAGDEESAAEAPALLAAGSLEVAPPPINIDQLAVDHTHQGSGYGREMVEFLEVRAAELGATELEASPIDDRARSFFSHLGYEVDLADEYLLRKQLD